MSNLRINLDDLLHNQSATVPWDARSALNATVDDLSETMVKEHLRACESALLDEPDPRTIYRKMDIVHRVNDHEVPRNVGLLFFSRDPTRWFPGAKIETSILRAGAGGDVLDEKVFDGGLAEQIRGCLAYLRREVIGSRTEKLPNQLRASDRPNYPLDALREVLFARPPLAERRLCDPPGRRTPRCRASRRSDGRAQVRVAGQPCLRRSGRGACPPKRGARRP